MDILGYHQMVLGVVALLAFLLSCALELEQQLVDKLQLSVAKSKEKKASLSTTPKTPGDLAKGPHNCSVVCDDIIIGKTENKPVGFATSGTAQRIYPSWKPDEGVLVYCDCSNSSGEAWTVFQRRMDGSVDFYRNWFNYTNGFGNVSGEFWLGLESISALTSSGEYMLRVDLEDWDGNTRYAEYRNFSISDKMTNYTMRCGAYSGDAGDSLLYHNGRPFTTKDVMNHPYKVDGNCAIKFRGAWWFGICYQSHLNGRYYQRNESVTYPPLGVAWNTWLGQWYSMKTTEMKFSPIK